jgi:WD40 repeat protein
MTSPSTNGSRIIVPAVGPIDCFAAADNLRLVAVAGMGAPVTIWEVSASGMGAYRGVVDEDATQLAWSPDASLLALSTADAVRLARRPGGRTAQVWGSEPVAARTDRTHALAFSPDAAYLAVAGADGCLAVGVGDGRTRRLSDRPAAAVRFTPDGDHLLVGDWEGALTVWRTGSWRECGRSVVHAGRVWALAVSDDSRWVATGADYDWSQDDRDLSVQVLEIPTLAWVAMFDVGGTECLAFRPRTRQLTVNGGKHRTTSLFHVSTARWQSYIHGGDDESGEGLAYSPTGSRLLVASFTAGTVAKLEMLARTRRAEREWMTGAFPPTGRLAVDARSRFVAVEECLDNDYDSGGRLRCAHLAPAVEVESALMAENWEVITQFGFLGYLMWALLDDGRVVRTDRGSELHPDPLEVGITCAGVGPAGMDGLTLGGAGGAVSEHRFHQQPDGWSYRIERDELLPAHHCAWAHLARLSATEVVGVDAEGHAWTVHSGRTHSVPPFGPGVGHLLAVGGDGAVVGVGQDSGAWLWWPRSAEVTPLAAPPDLPDHRPVAAAFSPDGRELTVSWGDTIGIHAVGHHAVGLLGHVRVGRPVRGLAWTPDGPILAGIPGRGVERWHRDEIIAGS